MDWPRDRLTIQLLDDGDGEAHDELAPRARRGSRRREFPVLRRGDRKGFKAGNLAFGLAHSDAPFVAVLDADFVPPPISCAAPCRCCWATAALPLCNRAGAMPIARANWLTRVQGLLLDAHFSVEQEARFRAGCRCPSTAAPACGTAPPSNRAAAGPATTLTEDLDLSMRCMMQGWRGAMVSGSGGAGGIAQTAAAWRAQQARWTKGHAQVARKLLPVDLVQYHARLEKSGDDAADVPIFLLHAGFRQRRDLAHPDVYGRGLLSGVTWLGLMVTGAGHRVLHRLSLSGPAHASPPARTQAVSSLLLAVVFPSGLILANTRATFDAFFSSRMDFNRTTRVGEIQKGGWRGVPELVVGVVLPVFAFAESNWSALFFFFAVSGLVSIGAMGAIAPRAVRQQITPASSHESRLVRLKNPAAF
jgi:hypothetical protein